MVNLKTNDFLYKKHQLQLGTVFAWLDVISNIII
jgi:hypothetical protein